MDTEDRKKSSNDFTFLKNNSTGHKNKCLKLNTGKFVKRTASLIIKEASEELKRRTCPGSSRADCVYNLTSGQEHGESGIFHFKESVKLTNAEHKWMPMNHIKNTEISNAHDTEITTQPFSAAKAKKLPIKTRNAGHLLLPQTNMINVSREDVQQNHYHTFYAKESAPVIWQLAKVQGSKHTLTTETILHHDQFEESSYYIEIPFCQSHNNIPDPKSSVHPIDKMHEDLYDKHLVSYKEMPTVSTALDNKEVNNNASSRKTSNYTSKSVTEHEDINIRRSSLPQDKAIVATTVNKQNDKPAENSTYRRFLLIDSQGLPYTVVVEEPKAVKTSNLSNETNVNSSRMSASRSLAPRKVYTCPVCFRIFEYLSYLQRHSIAHSQQKPHLCKICGKAFKRTSHLTRHKYTHFGGKPFQCQICKHSFRDMRELARHQQIHTGEKHYQCDVCYMNFSDCRSLQGHTPCHTMVLSGESEWK